MPQKLSRTILFCSLNAAIMLLLAFFWLNQSKTYDNEYFFLKWTSLLKKSVRGEDNKPSPDSILYIDVSGSKALINVIDPLYEEDTGPKGLHTISPEEEHRTVNNEFIIAITEELFAPIILVGTFANNIVFDPYHYFGFNGSSFSFFDKTYFPINLTEFEHGSQLAFLHQTDEGLIHQLAPHEDGNLLINVENFNSISKGNTIHATTIIIVKDMPRWLELIKGKNEVTEIIDNVEVFGILPQIIEADSNQIDLDSLGNKIEIITPSTPFASAIILDNLGAIRFISERSFIKDIKFYVIEIIKFRSL